MIDLRKLCKETRKMPNQNNGQPPIPNQPKTFDRTLRPWQTNPTLGPAFINGAQVRSLTPEEKEHFIYNVSEGFREDLEELPKLFGGLMNKRG